MLLLLLLLGTMMDGSWAGDPLPSIGRQNDHPVKNMCLRLSRPISDILVQSVKSLVAPSDCLFSSPSSSQVDQFRGPRGLIYLTGQVGDRMSRNLSSKSKDEGN